MNFITKICARVPVIPVLIVDQVDQAVPLAEALVSGGLSVLEVTLRTNCALDAISAMRAACPQAVVGAGTLRGPEDVSACLAAGAAFGVSPGATPHLLDAVEEAGMPFLPGCATPSEAMALAERGYQTVKFFPAGAAGGPAMLAALASPLPELGFCPTGGVSLANAPDYLRLPNVRVVGGSWVAPQDLVQAGDWRAIRALAREAVTMLCGVKN